MAELRRDVREVRAGCQHVGRQGVAQIGRSPSPHLRLVLHPVPDTPQEIGVIDRRSVFVRENAFPGIECPAIRQRLFLPFHPQPLQPRREFGTHVYFALRRSRLRGFHLPVVEDVLADDDVALFKIDVVPLKGRDLTDPHRRSGHA